MSIINCKVQYIRPKYNNLEEWMKDENNIYIGRAGVVFIDKQRFPKNSSNFANPFKIGKDGNREEVLYKYKTYIIERLKNNILLQHELITMKGKNLGCWCAPEPCHGNILLELIDNISKELYICNFCELKKKGIEMITCSNCNRTLCNDCKYGDDITPEGINCCKLEKNINEVSTKQKTKKT